jgi:hypothetical protein
VEATSNNFCDHFKALELAVFGVKLEETVNVIFGDKEIHSAVVFFIMFLSHHLFKLIFEGIGVKINMRKMRTISDKVFELSVMCHFSIVNIWEVSLSRNVKAFKHLLDESEVHCCYSQADQLTPVY